MVAAAAFTYMQELPATSDEHLLLTKHFIQVILFKKYIN